MVLDLGRDICEDEVVEERRVGLKDCGVVKINGIEWRPVEGVRYLHDYYDAVRQVEGGLCDERSMLRYLFLEDLWALLYFGMGVSIANCEWWVDRAFDVQRTERGGRILDLWARDHGKSTIITIGQTIQDVLKNPEERIGIFSYTKAAALKFFRSIKFILEYSQTLKNCFPDVLWQEPGGEAPKWSEEAGMIVKRVGFYKEATIEAWGLVEGMPIGSHFTKRRYDDISTFDLVNTPELMQKVIEAFDMSQSLGSETGDECWVTGTPYHHEDVLNHIRKQVGPDGQPLYLQRICTATVDGTPAGRSSYMSEKRLERLRSNKRQFFSQYLLDPTPRGAQQLDSDALRIVEVQKIPKNLYKFMTVDPAGERTDNRSPDSWALIVHGVDPFMDDLGASDWFILDMIIKPMPLTDALNAVVDMYSRHGRILKLGVEKVGIMTFETHIAAALRAKRKNITVQNGGLALLKPGGRAKELRISMNLEWPLNNGKIHISSGIPNEYTQRLIQEMQKFPYWHDDGLDALSYGYDLVKDYPFPSKFQQEDSEEERFYRSRRKKHPSQTHSDGWLIAGS